MKKIDEFTKEIDRSFDEAHKALRRIEQSHYESRERMLKSVRKTNRQIIFVVVAGSVVTLVGVFLGIIYII